MYGAKHVTLASHSGALYDPINDYVNQSLYRIRQFIKEGLMSLHLGAEMRRANATHAVLAQQKKRGVIEGIANEVTVAADFIIGALGFTTDAALVSANGFGNNGSLNDATHETSIPGIFNLGVSGVAPRGKAHRSRASLARSSRTRRARCSRFAEDGVLQHVGVYVETKKDRAKDSGGEWCAEQPLWHAGVCAALGEHQQDADCKLSSDGFNLGTCGVGRQLLRAVSSVSECCLLFMVGEGQIMPVAFDLYEVPPPDNQVQVRALHSQNW